MLLLILGFEGFDFCSQPAFRVFRHGVGRFRFFKDVKGHFETGEKVPASLTLRGMSHGVELLDSSEFSGCEFLEEELHVLARRLFGVFVEFHCFSRLIGGDGNQF